jgi:hypothetical protein
MNKFFCGLLVVAALGATAANAQISYNRIGNTTYGSDGTSYNRICNTTYGSDGSSCSRIGTTVHCR